MAVPTLENAISAVKAILDICMDFLIGFKEGRWRVNNAGRSVCKERPRSALKVLCGRVDADWETGGLYSSPENGIPCGKVGGSKN